jgi:peptidylprolyl isomerase
MANLWHIVAVLVVSIAIVGGLALWFEYEKGATAEVLLKGEEQLAGPYAPEELAVTNPAITNDMNRVATFNTNKGVIKIELFEDQMPVTTGNFIKLAEGGFYNGTKFHRVIDGFMIQGGDPNSRGTDAASYGTGGPGYTIKDEYVSGEFLTNTRGTIAMANTGQPNSGGSQFFINLVDNTGLDFDKQPFESKHPVFGRVIAGMDVVDTIAKIETGPRDVPVDPVVIETVTIAQE